MPVDIIVSLKGQNRSGFVLHVLHQGAAFIKKLQDDLSPLSDQNHNISEAQLLPLRKVFISLNTVGFPFTLHAHPRTDNPS